MHRKIPWTKADRARHRAIRERYAGKLAIDELPAGGEFSGPFPLGDYLDLRVALAELKKT